MSTIDNTLAQRGKSYGEFRDHAAFAQDLKIIMRRHRQWYSMPPDAREALDMIQHKIARILNGDPNFHDSWHDIIGYARLVEQRIEYDQQAEAHKDAKAEPADDGKVNLNEEGAAMLNGRKVPLNAPSNEL